MAEKHKKGYVATSGPLLILPPALKRRGSPRRQGLCSHLAHKWGRRQPMCDPEGCSTVWGAVGGGGPLSLTQTQHLFRQAPAKRANTQS